MLILSRKIGETIIIGEGQDAITIQVCDIRDKKVVRLGTTAPFPVVVDRDEIRRLKKKKKDTNRK
jgi:carbon storage regulator CsrA